MCFRVTAIAAALAFTLATDAEAVLLQEVVHLFDDPSGNRVLNNSDRIRVPPDMLRVVQANVAGLGYTATGSIGTLGNLGISSSQFTAGSSQNAVRIEDTFVNLLGVPRTAVANFIINGGMVTMIGPGTAEFSLAVEARIFENSTFVDSEIFLSQFDLTAAGFGPVAFSPSGDDIGAFLADPNRVEIPLSFHSLDLGVIPANGSVDLSYQVIFNTDFPSGLEGVFFEFSDPLNVDGRGEFPEVVFSGGPAPGNNAVPEPATATLALLGIAGLMRRRRAA